MKRFGMYYATRKSHTRQVAERAGETLRKLGFETNIEDVRQEAGTFDLSGYQGFILAASVHSGSHEGEMIRFVKLHREQLEAVPSVFLSVSLSEAGVERSAPESDERQRFLADLKKVEESFLRETGWHHERFKAIAGDLPYSKYDLFTRFVMKHISMRSGGDTDTSRDYDYTDWAGLETFIKEFATTALVPPRAEAVLG